MIVSASKRAEARCRYYTREEAKRVGWDVRHPQQGGLFLEEQELVDCFPKLKASLGRDRPDFGALDGSRKLRLVVECKNDSSMLDKAVQEACDYADVINRSNGFDVRIAVGVAGTPDKRVQIRDYFLKGTQWVPLTSHGFPLTQLPTLLELDTAIVNADGTTDVQLPNEREFFDAAIKISQILRTAKVEEPLRPKVVGAIVLALYQGDFNIDSQTVLDNINTNVRAAIQSFGDVTAEKKDFLARTLALSTESHSLKPVVEDIVSHLERLNVRSIMRSGVDFLGQFYEAFLRYGCDSTKMGIVFTPRHITKFCAELTDIHLGAKVYDPAAGTGGFLVAAYDRMMKQATTSMAKRRVKEALYGCDTNATVWALSVLNMFFRGDGKSHILYQDCFKQKDKVKERFDRVLLNPPYSQEGEPEIDFIDHSLSSLKPGGELAVVVKTNVMVDNRLAAWRRNLVETHHVLGVISLPSDLFYPTGVATVILLVRAHSPSTEGTFLARIKNDGFEISKKRRVPIAGSQLPTVGKLFQDYRSGKLVPTTPNVACIVDRNLIAKGDEICAEQWLPSEEFDLAAFDYWRRECFRQMSLAIANYPEIDDEIIQGYEDLLAAGPMTTKPRKRARLKDWFFISNGASIGAKNYPGGSIPFASSADNNNSIVTFIEPPPDQIYDTPHVTVTAFGQASIQPWRFAARGNGGSAVRILRPRFGVSLAELIWLIGQINAQKWRFHYGRMAIADRLNRLEVDPPPHNLSTVSGIEARLIAFKNGFNQLVDGEQIETSFEDDFRNLVIQWKSRRSPVSTVKKIIDDEAYRSIIQMGERVLPLLLAELEREPDHWFSALATITGASPVPKESRGKIKDMTEAWLAWGRQKGYIET